MRKKVVLICTQCLSRNYQVSVTVVAAIGLLLCDFISTEILRAFEIAFNGGSSSSSSAAAAILKLGGLL